MTADEWDSCTCEMAMLEPLRDSRTASGRKLRLFACACCRQVWGHMAGAGPREAIEQAEAFADGAAGRDDLLAAYALADAARGRLPDLLGPSAAQLAVGLAIVASVYAAATEEHQPFEERGYDLHACVSAAADSAARSAAYAGEAGQDLEAALRAERRLLRCIFGNPFRPLRSPSPSLLDSSGGLVIRLAEAAYEHRLLPSGHLDNARLAVLADSLEEAGCDDAELLAHLRAVGPHVRGCAGLDAVLGRP